MTNRVNAKAMLSTRLKEVTYKDHHSLNIETEDTSSKRPKTVVVMCLTEIL